MGEGIGAPTYVTDVLLMDEWAFPFEKPGGKKHKWSLPLIVQKLVFAQGHPSRLIQPRLLLTGLLLYNCNFHIWQRLSIASWDMCMVENMIISWLTIKQVDLNKFLIIYAGHTDNWQICSCPLVSGTVDCVLSL